MSGITFLILPIIHVWLGKGVRPILEKGPIESEIATLLDQPEKLVEEKEIQEIKTYTTQIETPLPTQRQVRMNLSAVSGSGSGSGSGNGLDAGSEGEGVAVASGQMGTATYQPGETDEDAEPMYVGFPEMPLKAEREGVAGFAEVLWVVNEMGRAVEIQIVREDPVGYGFGVSAQTFLKKSRFKPAKFKGVPVRMYLKQSFKFSIQN